MKPVEVAVAVLQAQDRVFLRRRRNTDHLEGFWEFPGGKIEEGETPEQALIREVSEETNLNLDVHRLEELLVVEHQYPERRVRLHFFRCRLKRAPRLAGGRWVRISRLDGLRLPEANRSVVLLLKARE